jgi:hypothetical protein
MDVIDLLITIVVVTILVTIILAVVTYVAYKLRLAREPNTMERSEDGLRYFVRFSPPGAGTQTSSPPAAQDSTPERHAPEA